MDGFKQNFTYKLVVDVEFVNDGIPNGVQLAGRVVILEREIVTTAVTSREIGIDSADRVHGLVDVAQIVDEQAKGIGASAGLILVVVVHHSLEGVTVLIVGLVREPVNDVGNVLSDVVSIKFELGIVLEVSTLVEVRDVNEVPVRLPAATLVLNHIGKGSAFNEWVLVLAACDGLASKS